MKRAGLPAIVLLAVSGPALAGGKTALPRALTADNGLAAMAMIRGGGYLTRVIMHFAGMDPPLEWGAPPRTAEVIPAWMDEPAAMSASAISLGMAGCGTGDLANLAANMRGEALIAAAPQGLIHVEAPAAAAGPAPGLDSRAIYGHSSDECILSARN
jgi:hypothetical protein